MGDLLLALVLDQVLIRSYVSGKSAVLCCWGVVLGPLDPMSLLPFCPILGILLCLTASAVWGMSRRNRFGLAPEDEKDPIRRRRRAWMREQHG